MVSDGLRWSGLPPGSLGPTASQANNIETLPSSHTESPTKYKKAEEVIRRALRNDGSELNRDV